MEIGDEIKILIRDDITIGKAHVYGEVFVPLITFKKNEDVEDWYPLRGTKKKSLIDVVEDNGSLLLRINFQVHSFQHYLALSFNFSFFLSPILLNLKRKNKNLLKEF